MRAVQINSYGGNEVLEINQNAPKPTLSKNQVLVEVYAASINPVDWKIRSGFLKDVMPLTFPAILGGDFAGIVRKVQDIHDFRENDEVYGSAIVLNGGSGSFAQYVAANIKNIARKPKNIDFIEASVLPLVGASAVQALEDHIKLATKQKILIHGGAGGIGHIAIQLAKHLGAYVATTVGSEDMEYAKSLGADEVIDYKTQVFENMLKDFDAVFDTVGGRTTNQSFRVLKRGGVIVSMLGQPDSKLAEQHGVTGIAQFTDINSKRLARLAQLVESGKIKGHVDKIFPLAEIKKAITYQEQGHPRGKVALKMKD